MPNGGRLVVRTKREQGLSIIEFSDTGHGMTHEQQERAFGSLLQTTKRTGTGLGLAIVARVVEAHRGTVRISSQPERGTTVRIELPL